MGLVDEYIEIILNTKSIKYYENLGYEIPRYKNKNNDYVVKRNTKIIIKTTDLPKYSMVYVNVECDSCKTKKSVKYEDYLKCLKEDNLYYCSKCSRHGIFISFEKWCISNNMQHVLDLFDYELNDSVPSEISYGTECGYYFKCPQGIHDSEIKMIKSFTSGLSVIKCNMCNSLGSWMGNNLGKNAIEKYWGKKNKISPYLVPKGSSSKKYFFVCQEDLTHNDYQCSPANFTSSGSRCPICNSPKGEVRIKNYLDVNNIIYKYQKEFDGLVGINNGNLSYDFFIGEYNLLVEFQGMQHEKPIDFKGRGIKYAKEQFEIQKLHDNLKYNYAKNNNIKLLEIWYWDFDNIESILDEYLNKLSFNSKKEIK